MNVYVRVFVCIMPMSAISGVPSLSAATSAAGPTMNSWTAGPIVVTSNVIVSPA